MRANPLQFSRRERPQLPRNVAIAFGERDEGAPFDDEDDAIFDRLRRKLVRLADFETEHVAGEIEAADLPPAIVENLVSTHRTTDDLVKIIGGLVFSVNLGIAGKRHRGSHDFHLSNEVQRGSGRARRLRGTRHGALEGGPL